MLGNPIREIRLRQQQTIGVDVNLLDPFVDRHLQHRKEVRMNRRFTAGQLDQIRFALAHFEQPVERFFEFLDRHERFVLRRRTCVTSRTSQVAALSDLDQHIAAVIFDLITTVLARSTAASHLLDRRVCHVVVPHVGGQQGGEISVILAGLKHVNAAVFFDNVRVNLLQTFRANGSGRFDNAIKSKIGSRKTSDRRCETYELARIVQFIFLLIGFEGVFYRV